jgi:hypothetical protein
MRTHGNGPKLAIVAIVFALLGGIGAALWVRHEQNAKAAEIQNAARVERVEGEVAINNSLTDESNSEWIAATPNTPVAAGDRIYTRDNSRASIAFTGRNFARMNDGSALDVLSLSNRRTQLALRDGSALFDVGYLEPGELFEVATPYGAVDLNQPGLYEVGLNDNGGAWISVLSGLAQVVGLAGSGQISKGEMLTLLGQTAAQVALSRLDPTYAGGLIDDYYGYRYPDLYDGRYSNYNAYLSDPYYYDPYRRYNSYRHANYQIPGLYDLDPYGDWVDVNNYGYAWRPRVDYGWAPYQSGYWTNDYPYGLTWVSNEPWGYAPYHYGRWANVNNQWFWIPENASRPQYSPALVAFLPLNDNGVGWVPLGPGDRYASRYYDENWQAHYLTRADLRPRRVVNLDVPGAIAVVPWSDFDHVIDRRRIRHADWRSLGSVQPLLDPLLDTPLRNAALRSAWGRGKINLPPGIAKRLDVPVVTDSRVRDFPYRRDFARRLHVERIGDEVRNRRLEFRDKRRGERPDTRWNDHRRERAEIRRQLPQFERRQVEQRQFSRPVSGARGERTRIDRRRIEQLRQQEPARQYQRRLAIESRRQGEARGKRVGYLGPPVPERKPVSEPKNVRPRTESSPRSKVMRNEVRRQEQRSRPQFNRQAERTSDNQTRRRVQRAGSQGHPQKTERQQRSEVRGGGRDNRQKGGNGRGRGKH